MGRSLTFVTSLAAWVMVGCGAKVEDTAVETGASSGTVRSSDGAVIHYEVRGQGSPAVVLVHGWSCDRGYWDSQVDALAERFRVVRIDLAGHGDSEPRTDWSMAAFGADVAAVADELQLDDLVLVGHSMGGPVVLEAERLLEDRALMVIGVDTLKQVGKPTPPDQVEAFLSKARDDFAGTVSAMVSGSMFVPESDPVLKEWIVADMAAAPPSVGIGAVVALTEYNAIPTLDRLSAPLVLMNASYGPTNVEPIVSRVANFQLIEFDGVGHFLMMEQPERFNRDLMTLINGLDGG